MVKWKLFGIETRVVTLDLTVERIEAASHSELEKLISYAEMELDIARTKRRDDIAYAVEETIKLLRAQQGIINSRASRENGCLCGVVSG